MGSESTDEAPIVANTILGSFVTWLDDRVKAERPPELLYHFSDISGLSGILSDRRIRASLVTSLNDSSEVLYGMGLAQEVVE